jgi:hypothetical protein
VIDRGNAVDPETDVEVETKEVDPGTVVVHEAGIISEEIVAEIAARDIITREIVAHETNPTTNDEEVRAAASEIPNQVDQNHRNLSSQLSSLPASLSVVLKQIELPPPLHRHHQAQT